MTLYTTTLHIVTEIGRLYSATQRLGGAPYSRQYARVGNYTLERKHSSCNKHSLVFVVFTAITDPRPGHDFGSVKSFTFDHSYWSVTAVRTPAMGQLLPST